MNVRELMVGDWVIMPSHRTGEDTPTRVRNIYHTKDGDTDSIQDWYGNIEEEEFVYPIPLTEHELKVNGIEGIYRYNYYYSNDILRSLGIVITLNDEMVVSTWKDHNDNEYIEFSCAYVHELQHALRLCGLNELADKFVV